MIVFAKGWSSQKDGPGLRRIYYLKGCNLRCRWCASPESQSASPQLLFYADRVESAGPADALCPRQAIRGTVLDRVRCAECLEHPCRRLRHPALEWVGQECSPEQLVAEATRLAASWPGFSGVTFGGGEPTLQADELRQCLLALRAAGLHTAIESNAATSGYSEIAPLPDLVISDLKAGTPETLRDAAAGDLPTVLENLRFAATLPNALLVRVPVITTVNDSPAELAAIAGHLAELGARRREATGQPLQVEILRLHHFGEPKYQALGLAYPMAGITPPTDELIAGIEGTLARHGLQIVHN